MRYMGCSIGAEESEGAVSGHWGRHTVRSQWGGPDSSRENPRGQLSGRIEEKAKKRKGTAVPYIVFSARATGETQSKEGLVRNAASPGPGVSGQGGAGDGRWSPISVQAVERRSFGSGVAARGILRRKTP